MHKYAMHRVLKSKRMPKKTFYKECSHKIKGVLYLFVHVGGRVIRHKRYEISDEIWSLLEPYLPGRQGKWGGVGQDNRGFINAVFWVFYTGSSWRDLPSSYGDWSNTHRRFIRWRAKGVWERLLEVLIDAPGYEWLMMDLRAGKKRRRSMRRVKGASIQKYVLPWMRMVCRSSLLLHKVQQKISLMKLDY